jgi:L-cysteine:1D-myo-inositol 2-amino-2-deoxy-alpha-D-glucopyranoside ligase
VQAGGCDLVFPHHEMSASHARVAFVPATHVFARVYAHAGMVRYHGEKMSKSLGNLVFVSRLLADGVDPMAIRLALLAHHYRSDWEWTDGVLAEANARLLRWRGALARAGTGGGAAGSPDAVLADVRAALSDDLDAPRALAVIDRWADAVLAEDGAENGAAGERDHGADLVRRTADALLGVSI